VRVLHVTQAVGGGVSRHIVDIVRHVPGVTHDVVLPESWEGSGPSGAVYDLSAVETLRREGAHVHHLDLRRNVLGTSNAVSTLRLHGLIKELRPDIVHAHSAIGGAAGRLATIRTGTPVVYTPHGLMTNPFTLRAERVLGRLTTRLIGVSQSEARRAAVEGLCNPHRVVTIPNGIDLEWSTEGPDLRSEIGLASGTPLVGTVMRLIPQKAPSQFVMVAEEVSRLNPDAHFLLIGMGPLQASVDHEVSKRGLAQRFHQIHHLDDAAAVLGQLDVFVLPSRFEGGPYAALEAMRARTPVVLSDVVGNADVVEHRVSGMLVPFGRPAEMAKAVSEILDDSDLRSGLTRAAISRLEELFDVRKMGASIGQLYEAVSAEGRRLNTLRLPQLSSASSAHAPEPKAAL
jgi:glycosyltransferase involved in cell wall biosynthesis